MRQPFNLSGPVAFASSRATSNTSESSYGAWMWSNCVSAVYLAATWQSLVPARHWRASLPSPMAELPRCSRHSTGMCMAATWTNHSCSFRLSFPSACYGCWRGHCWDHFHAREWICRRRKRKTAVLICLFPFLFLGEVDWSPSIHCEDFIHADGVPLLENGLLSPWISERILSPCGIQLLVKIPNA
jgi:hypothetical protein